MSRDIPTRRYSVPGDGLTNIAERLAVQRMENAAITLEQIAENMIEDGESPIVAMQLVRQAEDLRESIELLFDSILVINEEGSDAT